jgi:hypothetical protein
LFKQTKYRFALLLLLAFVLAMFVSNYSGEFWEEKVRIGLYKIKGDSIPSFATELVDRNGIPFVSYSPENNITPGTHYNATIVANYSIEYFNKYQQQKDTFYLQQFNHCINWLKDNVTKNNNQALYYFNWRQAWYPLVKGKFTSGISSGRAIEALLMAYQLSKDTSAFQLAQQLMRGYYLPVQRGGFTYQEKDGWWYEELADSSLQTPRILDGHIYALLGVQKLWELTKQDSAKLLVDKGLQALKYQLAFYDAGNEIIYYDIYKKQADKKYQHILVQQMKELWQITGDTTFKNYYNKWSKPLNKPYLVRIVKEKNRSGLISFFLLFFSLLQLLFFCNNLICKK